MPPVRKPLVLVVDDDPTIQHLLERLLRLHAFTPLHATNIAEAVSVVGSKKVDAVILDLGLRGGESGADLLRALRRHAAYASLPALILTGLLLAEDQELALQSMGAEVWSKPQPMHRVIDWLKKALRV